jgi:hypothetical protein
MIVTMVRWQKKFKKIIAHNIGIRETYLKTK